MSTSLTIGNLSKSVGLSTKTIRYYEEINLITSAERSENGYRTYPNSAIEELQLIKSARDLGLPISEIKKLMKGCESGDCLHSGEYLDREISNYLKLLSGQLLQMTELKNKLTKLKHRLNTPEKLCNANSKYCCNILHQLVDDKGGEINNA